MEDKILSPGQARIAGLFYLITIISGVFAEIFTRTAIVNYTDSHATAINIQTQETLYRSGLISDVIMLCCYIVVTMMFYQLFIRGNRMVSRIAAGFSMIGIAVLSVNCLLHFLPLILLESHPALSHFSVVQREDMALFALHIHGAGYGVSLIFFGIYCVLLGILLYQTHTAPRIIALFMAIGGACHIFNNVANMLVPEFADMLPQFFRYPPLIGEIVLSFWLIIFGVRTDHHLEI